MKQVRIVDGEVVTADGYGKTADALTLHERVARALCKAWGYQWDACQDGCGGDWCDCLGIKESGDDCDRPSRDDFRKGATFALAAVRSPGETEGEHAR